MNWKKHGDQLPQIQTATQLMDLREEVLNDIFLDMHKAYDALERGRCLDILVAYGVGPLDLRLLWRYWYRLAMVSRECEYFGAPFKG